MTAQQKKILIVEDEVLVAMMLARKLEGQGFQICDVVGTGEEAITANEEHAPGAILMDVSLGSEMDGIEAGIMIRAESDVPIVFFTGYYQDKKLLKRAEVVQPLGVLDKLGPVTDILTVLNKAFQDDGKS